MRATFTCLTCGSVVVLGEDEPIGVGYLPGDYTADTCSVCHPELDDLPDDKPVLTRQRFVPFDLPIPPPITVDEYAPWRRRR